MNAASLFETLSNELADAVDAASPAVVWVGARRRMPSSGIAYAPDLVVTANHTVEREEDVSIRLHDGQQVQASLAGRDPARDIALLRLKEAVLTPAQAAPSPARVGQLVLALGRPDENGLQASLGVVSACGGPVRTAQGGVLEKYLRIDAAPLPGFSGGPLISAQGRLLGMNTSGLAMDTLLTLPSDLLGSAAQALAAHGHIRRPYLGIRSQDVRLGPVQQAELGREQKSALLLAGIEDPSPAANAGLLIGDILTGINHQPVSDHDELQLRLAEAGAGQAIHVELLRGGKAHTLQVTLGER